MKSKIGITSKKYWNKVHKDLIQSEEEILQEFLTKFGEHVNIIIDHLFNLIFELLKIKHAA